MASLKLKHIVFAGKATWYLISSPFKLTYNLSGLVAQTIGAGLLVTRDSFQCPGCSEPISLVGRWECGWCGYMFDGFFFARCIVCGAVPPYIACSNCGVGVKNPILYP